MSKILVVYYSQTGNTKKMAYLIAEGCKNVKDIEVEIKNVENINVDELLKADAIVVGSPTYYGNMAWQIKKLFDDSVKFHGELAGKIGGAFTSSANIGGGNETTIKSILDAMLIHGMIIIGDDSGDHYGPVSIGAPNSRVERQCKAYGQKIALLLKKIKP